MSRAVPEYQLHFDSAVALIRQRQNWLLLEQQDARPLLSLEQRLRMHLHVLANSVKADEMEPEQLYDSFIWIARRLQGNNRRLRMQAVQAACNWLKEKASKKAEGARLALSLYRTPETDELTQKLYRAEAELRPTLIYIWNTQGVPLPKGLLNQGEVHGQDVSLQSAVLNFAAENIGTGVEVFRHYYKPLLSEPGRLPHVGPVLRAALRGGILRGDPDVPVALRRAIELQHTEDELQALLRLAALSGCEEFYPLLQQHARVRPESGFALLALWGHRQAVFDLAAGLRDPRNNVVAASAWSWLTGQTLPLKPRLSLVGEPGHESGAMGDEDRVADLDVARAWWESHHSLWREGARWVAGRPMNRESLTQLARSSAGRKSADVLDLLQILTGDPIGVCPENWFEQREKKLAALVQTASPDTNSIEPALSAVKVTGHA